MARTRQGASLTEEHRKDQVSLGEKLIEVIQSLFKVHFDPTDIDKSAEKIAREAAEEVVKFRYASRLFSEDYLRAFQAVEAPEIVEYPEFPHDDYDILDAAQEILVATRIGGKKAAKHGGSLDDVRDGAMRAASGKAQKIALDGGRKLLEHEVNMGRRAVAYSRVVDADPCPFCAMLASRGVYLLGSDANGAGLYQLDSFKESNGRFQGEGKFKVHDFCSCTLEPVYRIDGKLKYPGNAEQLAKEWAQIAAGRPDALNVWRRWRERGQLPEDFDSHLDSPDDRPDKPVRGQSTGVRARPTVHKPSEKKGVDVDKVESVRTQLEGMRKNIGGLQDEITALRSTGLPDSDPALKALLQQEKQYLSRISRNEKWLAKNQVV